VSVYERCEQQRAKERVSERERESRRAYGVRAVLLSLRLGGINEDRVRAANLATISHSL